SFADSWQVEWIYGTRIFCCPQTDIHSSAVPMRGGEAALQFTMPWHRMARSGPEELGVRLRTAASSMRYNNSGKDHDEFSFLGGASWTFPLSERFGFDVYTLCGAALARGSWKPELVAGTSMGLLTSGFYKLKLFAEADWFPTSSPLSFVTGFSLSFCL
ncbi:MAG: hypothetical protein J5764_06590, partial [Bacteroidales bacterium]|nr:hypothetical protein [Bacteroidales bacterium]